ncbi:MAG: hypothetical protein ACJARS_003462 [bacterium]|jgi:hypothetical protein
MWDTDADGVGDSCPDDDNADQLDRDVDGIGDRCGPPTEPPDMDGDDVPDPVDRSDVDDDSCDLDTDGWCGDSDCDDRNATVNPRGLKLCDGVDCDGETSGDEADWDDDGWSDCDAGDGFIRPREDERGDGVDNNCMGGVDPLFCNADCSPTGCLCAVSLGPIWGWWTLMLLVFANRRRRA